MDSVLIIVRKQGDSRRQHLLINIDPDDTISCLKKKIRRHLDSDEECNILFTGRRLDDAMKIRDLKLGPSTSLTATMKASEIDGFEIVEKDYSSDNIVKPRPLTTFNVYCKNCAGVQAGKLRATCSVCSSTSILFTQEPNNHEDLILSNRITVRCLDCDTQTTCKFDFKCGECNEPSTLLYHIVPNRTRNECVICGEVEGTVFSLPCQHISCIPCITAYMEQIMRQWLFVYKRDVGFTLSCPMVDCAATVTDPHHFYVLGNDSYREYQNKSAQKYLEMQEGSIYCPFPECNAGFFVQPDSMIPESDANYVLCPECNRKFCVKCRNRNECICGIEDQSITLVNALSKPCPRCRVPTERNGGCAHMRCLNCTFEWCFLCESAWTDGCQWDHWFD
uniref:RBR-type E3 ubiquitin transferase n=1 Tax=Bursaphelenchus xylophilus TaxID=6326 RepID=A0A1I7STH4_BURXY